MEGAFAFTATIWLHPGPGGWHFASLPQDLSRRIKADFGGLNQGWGSLPVVVSVGGSRWSTSLFPDAKMGCYLLPLKAAVRARENLRDGDQAQIRIALTPRT